MIANLKPSPIITVCTPTEYAAALAALQRPDVPVSFLQAPYYGGWQERDGKTVVYFVGRDTDAVVAAGLAIQYDAPGGISFLYCPYGPVVAAWTPELLAAVHAFFAGVAKESGATFVRLDSAGLANAAGVKTVPNHLAATASLQPRAEWLLDIARSHDDIWMGLHKHARYNVRLAERANAKLHFYTPSDAPLNTFFTLMQTTAGRDSFGIQSRAYYEAVLQSVPAGDGFVAICTIDGKPAAAALFAAWDGVVHYVFAGSSNDFRKIAPPYFLLWNAILQAKKRGWTTLNFGGIADEVKSKNLAGVTAFKKRWGGHAVTHPNPVDLVYKPFRYQLFNLYKRLRG